MPASLRKWWWQRDGRHLALMSLCRPLHTRSPSAETAQTASGDPFRDSRLFTCEQVCLGSIAAAAAAKARDLLQKLTSAAESSALGLGSDYSTSSLVDLKSEEFLMCAQAVLVNILE